MVRRRRLLQAALGMAAPAAGWRIVDPPDGAILNRHDGQPAPAGLRVEVRGECAAGAAVTVNGIPARVEGGRFRARVTLSRPETRVTAAGGAGRATATLLWDRRSFPRYRVSTDDNIWFLRDLAQNAGRYRSLFENPYLGMWRDLHRKYGAKVHFDIYYETEGFNLSQMPACYREEWRANRDWIRLSFHARANDPARPYLEAPASRVLGDYRLVTREIARFAGPELLSPVTTIHWGEARREAVAALRREGIRVLLGYFQLADGKPRVSYYLDAARTRYLAGRDYWKDTATGMVFVRHDIVMNTVPLNGIVPHLERVAADPHQSEVMELMIHEQYFYPHYQAYEPDYRQRVETAIAWAARKGYRPVFFGDGFVGAR